MVLPTVCQLLGPALEASHPMRNLWEKEEQEQGQLAPSLLNGAFSPPPLSVQHRGQGVADDHSSIVKMSLAPRVPLCLRSHTFTVLFSLTHSFYRISSLAATFCSAHRSLSKGARFFSCCCFFLLHNSLQLSPYRCGPEALMAFDCASRLTYLKMDTCLQMDMNTVS